MAGCLMALYLSKDGFDVEIYESREDTSDNPTLSQRSINQSLSIKGIQALKEVNLWGKVKKIAIAQKGRTIHDISGQLLYQAYGKRDKLIEWTVNRNELNSLLLREVKKNPHITVFFNEKVTAVDSKRKLLYLENAVTLKKTTKKVHMIIGADGINSAVREFLEKTKNTQSRLEQLSWGYKNIYITDNQLEFAPNAFHLWSRKNAAIFGMMNKGSFTCTLTLPLSGKNSFQSLNTINKVKRFFSIHFPDLIAFLPSFAEAFVKTKPTVFKTLYTSHWFYKDFIVLIGDAAHAMTIFYGQGINAAFDDCRFLSLCLRKNIDYNKAFYEFQTLRKKNTDVIADLCVKRFFDLRDKYESPFYIARGQIDSALESLLPGKWQTLYTLIVHTKLPYFEGLKYYQKQKLIGRILGLDILVLLLGIYSLVKKQILAIGYLQPSAESLDTLHIIVPKRSI